MSIKMYVPTNLSCQQEEDLGRKITQRARALLASQGIQAPKKIGYVGCYGSWISFNYNRNAVKDALEAAIKESSLAYTIQ